MKKQNGHPWLAVIIAVAVLAGLSFVPWSDTTGGYIKDFNLVGDIIHHDKPAEATANEIIDPELEKALAEEASQTGRHSRSNAADTLKRNHALAVLTANDTLPAIPVAVPEPVNPRQGDLVIIEDYTPEHGGLRRLRDARAHSSRPARIAVIGDSYIEGDIMTMDLRQNLQDRLGGEGVGYVPMQSELTGFRVSVRETCRGWTATDIRKKTKSPYNWLAGEYFTASAGARTTFKGVKRPHLSSWSVTQVLYIAPSDGTISITTDAGRQDFAVTASEQVACARVDGATAVSEITTDIPGLVVLGTFLDGTDGIAVDNMSLRGNSGISHRHISEAMAAQMRPFIDYDLIIVEYGINALSSRQSNYSSYGKLMEQVLAQLRRCYPYADILLMGIGDRGQKVDGSVASLPTAPAMVKAQREAARNAGVLFWDTREAMGGSNSIVDWRNRKLVNADYIHLNARGGQALAALLSEAIFQMMDNQ